MSQLNCHYCNAAPANLAKARLGAARGRKRIADHRVALYEWVYQGIDRIDSSLPHDSDNCVPCCSSCNSAKMALSYQVFLAHVKRIYRFRVRPRGQGSFDLKAFLAGI
jgi:hypothetical protein